MFRGHFKLAAHMVFHQFSKEGIVRVRQQIIETDAGTDEYFLYAGQGAQTPKQCQVVCMICPQVWAGFWEKALPVLAYPLGQLFLTGRLSEIGCGTAHIMNMALKILVFCNRHGFL